MRKFLLFVLLAMLTACSTPNQKPDSAGLPKASKSAPGVHAKSVPNITLTDIKTGALLNFSEIKKPVVVTFWASWCTTCRKEFPLWRDKDLATNVIGVNVQDAKLNNQLRIDAYNLMKKNGTVFPSYVDTDEVLTSHLGLVGLPVTIVVASDGSIINRHDGLMTKQQMMKFIALTKN